MSVPVFLSDDDVRRIASDLPNFTSVDEACRHYGIRSRLLRSRLQRLGMPSPGELLRSSAASKLPAAPAGPSDIERLTAALGREPASLEALCDRLDWSPKRLRAVADAAHAAGFDVTIDAHTIGRTATVDVDARAPVVIAAPKGEWQSIGVISDTHLGSKYCLREQIRDFVHHAYANGVREILHPGDMLDGCYRHAQWEVTHPSLDDQTRDLCEVLPKLKGLSYHAILGNHDETFWDKTGVDVGRYIVGYFRDRGRDDLRVYGMRGATLKVRGALVELWHPRGSGAYAKSYKAQIKIRDSFGPYKPDILLIGHYHTFNYCDERGIHAVMCPTFQGGSSAFGKSLTGTPAIGGLQLRWRLTEDGTLRDFVLERRAYYEREAPRELQPMGAYAVEPARLRAVAEQEP